MRSMTFPEHKNSVWRIRKATKKLYCIWLKMSIAVFEGVLLRNSLIPGGLQPKYCFAEFLYVDFKGEIMYNT